MANLLKIAFYMTIFLALAMMVLSKPVHMSRRIAEHEEHEEQHLEFSTELTETEKKFDATTMENEKLLFRENFDDPTDFGSSKDKLLFSEKALPMEEFSTVEPETLDD